MVRNGCANVREGDLFHGRYRILRGVDNDRTGAMYEAVDMMTDGRRILKVVQAETLAGTGICVRFKSDAPLWDAGNVAYVSDAGLDHDTRSFFLVMELAEDSEEEPVTRQRVIRLSESGSVEMQGMSSASDSHPELDPTILRAAVPLSLAGSSPAALPPPAAPLPGDQTSGSHSSAKSARSGSLPPPTPPPERPSQVAAPLPRTHLLSAGHFIALLGVAIGVVSVAHLHLSRAAKERLPERTGAAMEKAPEMVAPISTATITPNAAPMAAALAEPGVPDPSGPTNWISSETASPKAEGTALKTAPAVVMPPEPDRPKNTSATSTKHNAVQPKPASPKAPAPMTNKSSTDSSKAAAGQRQRESIY